MAKHKKSFFERLTGSSEIEEMEEKEDYDKEDMEEWMEENNEEAQLTIDVYQTPDDIIIKSIVAGVKPDDLDVDITHEMITIRGKREQSHLVEKDDYFYKELYWGSFSRSILLPAEVDPDEAEAKLKDGLLTVKIPKLNKQKTKKLKIKAD